MNIDRLSCDLVIIGEWRSLIPAILGLSANGDRLGLEFSVNGDLLGRFGICGECWRLRAERSQAKEKCKSKNFFYINEPY